MCPSSQLAPVLSWLGESQEPSDPVRCSLHALLSKKATVCPWTASRQPLPSLSLCCKPEGCRGWDQPAWWMPDSVNPPLASVTASVWNELANTLRATNLFLFPSTTHRIDLAGWAATNPTEKGISKFKASFEVLIHHKLSCRQWALTCLLLRLILGFIDLP